MRSCKVQPRCESGSFFRSLRGGGYLILSTGMYKTLSRPSAKVHFDSQKLTRTSFRMLKQPSFAP
jgi:hypothetical protein